MSRIQRSCTAALLAGAAFAVAIPFSAAMASEEHLLYSFTGGGAYPNADVRLDDSGNLYGTTTFGGDADSGTVFKIASDGTESVVHSFDGEAGGSSPNTGVLIQPSTGDLYGTTPSGGSGSGVIYKLAADGTYSVPHSFDNINDGSNPEGRLIGDKMGNLYGVAASGGANDAGTVFELKASGKFKVLHTFSGTDGSVPAGVLQRDRAGNLYGATNSGGAHNDGTVFKIAPDGTLTTLYSFAGGSDGAFPDGGLARDKADNLYGATFGGGAANTGTVFKLTPGGTETVLYSFTGGSDGGRPEGDLLLRRGALYGVTTGGGDPSCQCGVVFEITRKNTERVRHSFTGATADGSTPFAGVTKGADGTLYGTTEFGGALDGGTVFSLTKN
ncbi:MAG TPA: choice-of-anchor tandem repeat GloVer-containing protein [Rhizomicrobium sp.]|jgi:uncharacterized repeat protein (TIGR03803 family)|nr:choice-of-anchor tandem repeat GloVer-containing protein [Rhizomicrobium sp.]